MRRHSSLGGQLQKLLDQFIVYHHPQPSSLFQSLCLPDSNMFVSTRQFVLLALATICLVNAMPTIEISKRVDEPELSKRVAHTYDVSSPSESESRD